MKIISTALLAVGLASLAACGGGGANNAATANNTLEAPVDLNAPVTDLNAPAPADLNAPAPADLNATGNASGNASNAVGNAH